MQLSWNTNLPVVSYRQIRLGSRHDGVWWASSHYRSVSRRFIWCSCTSWHISTLRCSSSLSKDWLCSTAKPLHMSDVRRHSDCSTSTRSLSFCFFSLQHNTHTAHTSDGKSPYTVLSWDSLSRQYFHCLALGLEGYCLNLHFSLALTYLLPFFVRSACTRLPQPSWLWAIRQQHQQQQSSFYGHYTGQPASAGTYS